jgi:glycosyltransferase involved in cell wall biosynthesis
MVAAPLEVAIVVPFYGDPDELRECLDSLRAQTYADWRAVVVDDASPQPAAPVVAALADPRIELVRHQTNRGLAAARNTGVQHSRAPWLLPVDADDRLPADVLERLLAAVAAAPDVDVFFGDLQIFGEQTGVWRYPVGVPAALTRQQWLPGAGALLRRALWQRAGGWCEQAVFRAGNEDWDFWLAVAATGPLRVAHIGAIAYQYRRRAGSMSVGSLQRNDGHTRLAMLARHPQLFASPADASRFVCDGIGRSIAAHLRRFEWRGAGRWLREWLGWRWAGKRRWAQLQARRAPERA